jgi:soluble lytic murein transglycosylase-like protein
MGYICRLVPWVFMASAVLQAANAPSTAPQITSVVRANSRTGHLVRTVVVSPRVVAPRVVSDSSAPAAAHFSTTDPDIEKLIDDLASSYGLDPLLVHSVVKVESGYNPYAVSSKGAQGLMQLIPSTQRRFGVSNGFDVRENVEGGVRYLKHLLALFNGDQRLAVAAYNAGEGAVFRYNNVPPYPETMSYVYRVGKKYGEAKRVAAARPKTQTVAAPEPPKPEHPPVAMYRDDQGRIYLRTR